MTIMNSPPGANATIQTNVHERYVYGLINFGQLAENDKAKNPNGLNYIVPSSTGDDNTFRADLTFPIRISNGQIKANSYLQDVSFNWDGGGFGGSSWVEELILAIVEQRNLEFNSTANPQKENRISWSIASTATAGSKATFTASVSIKIATILNSDGSTSNTAEPYLT